MPKKQAKTEEERATAHTRRVEAKAQRERTEAKKEQETMDRRRAQLEVAISADDRLRVELREIRRRERARESLSDHVGGFYEEIDKLAKGKAMLEATNLAVEEANQIIQDAKALVVGDPFLERVKEFVPAGQNPVYPDVVVTLRNVRQALGRAESQFASLAEATESAQADADTVRAALELYVEKSIYAAKDDVKAALAPREVIDSWFVRTNDGIHFDYDRLDAMDLSAALCVDMTEL